MDFQSPIQPLSIQALQEAGWTFELPKTLLDLKPDNTNKATGYLVVRQTSGRFAYTTSSPVSQELVVRQTSGRFAYTTSSPVSQELVVRQTFGVKQLLVIGNYKGSTGSDNNPNAVVTLQGATPTFIFKDGVCQASEFTDGLFVIDLNALNGWVIQNSINGLNTPLWNPAQDILYTQTLPISQCEMYVAKGTKTYMYDDEPEVYSYEFAMPTIDDALLAMRYAASMVEYGIEARTWSPGSAMFFDKTMLYQWISPQQVEQFVKMFPNCIPAAYDSALGYIKSQIGELYDIPAILAGDTNTGTAQIMRWILSVLTAYNLSSPSMKHSQVLMDNYEMVVRKVTEMKNGATTLNSAPVKDAPNAWGGVVNSGKNKMLG